MKFESVGFKTVGILGLVIGVGPLFADPANSDTKQSPPAPQAGQQVGLPVNQELYGNTGPAAPPQHYQTTLLPSEALIDRQKSGATPSEIRTLSDRVGPLSPYGAAAYIPANYALQRALGLPVPIMYGPAFENPNLPGQLPVPVPGPALNHAPIRQPVENQSPQYIAPQRLGAGALLSPNLTPTATEGTVYYRRPVRPTTQPTTQPTSPGERP